jgi:magnesium transporter
LALSPERSGEWKVVGKEVTVGLVNGLVIGLLAALVGLVLPEGGIYLGVVVMLAMWGNLIVAGFAGAFVPVLLERLGVDPAVASSVFFTALTDIFGFFFLLGLASWILLPRLA